MIRSCVIGKGVRRYGRGSTLCCIVFQLDLRERIIVRLRTLTESWSAKLSISQGVTHSVHAVDVVEIVQMRWFALYCVAAVFLACLDE